jgi:uncharacterized protein (DUF433 family)
MHLCVYAHTISRCITVSHGDMSLSALFLITYFIGNKIRSASGDCTGASSGTRMGGPFEKEARVVTNLDRITQNPLTMGGKACIRGIRVTVGMIVGQIGAGRSIDELLTDYPYLEREDILQALRYAACPDRPPQSIP